MKVTKEITFCAAHRLYRYVGCCSNIHGHNYRVLITCKGEEDTLGMVMDFSVMKRHVLEWINLNWDHALLINSEDVELMALSGKTKTCIFRGKNPTAENMVSALLFQFEWLDRVRVYETETSYAEAGREE